MKAFGGFASAERNGIVASVVSVACMTNAFGAGLTSQSYVQDGLVVQFDALENSGVGSYGESARTWVDLKGDASIPLKAGAGWENRYFDSTTTQHTILNMPAYNRMSLTMETAINVCSNGRPVGVTSTVYPRFFSQSDNLAVYFENSGNIAVFLMNSHATRPRINSFRNGTVSCYAGNSYFGVALDGVTSQQSTSPASGSPERGATDWTLNGGGNGYLHGHYYALRFYDRMLSIDEIAYNALIDKLRFWSYTYAGNGAMVNWSEITWSAPEKSTSAVPGTQTSDYAQIKNATVSVGTADVVSLKGLSLEDGATLNMAEGAVVSVKVLYVEGQAVPRGIYSGSRTSGEQANWLSGSGVVRVAGSIEDPIPDIYVATDEDGWCTFGLPSAQGGSLKSNIAKWKAVAEMPDWARIAVAANAKARFVGYVILDTIPVGRFVSTDFSQAEQVLLHGTQAFADGSELAVPSGVTLRYQPGVWKATANENEFELQDNGESKGTTTTDLDVSGELNVSGDGTHLQYPTFAGSVSGTGTIKVGSYRNQGRFSGDFLFAGSISMVNPADAVWVDSLVVTSHLGSVGMTDVTSTGNAHVDARYNVDGLLFGRNASAATADNQLHISALTGGAHSPTDSSGLRWRSGAFLAVWGGNTIHAATASSSFHLVGRPKDLGCSSGFIGTAESEGFGNVIFDEWSGGNLYLSTNVNLTVGTVKSVALFDYTYHVGAVNRSTLDITTACAANSTVKATDLAMLPARMSGFNGSVMLTDGSPATYEMPIDLAHGPDFLYNTVGCIGSGKLVAAPTVGTINVTFDTMVGPRAGKYALARFSSGGELLSGWTVLLNGQPEQKIVCRQMQISVKKDATGLWLDVKEPRGLAIVIR